MRRRMERNEGEEGEREAVRKRMDRKGEKGSEEDDYFNKFPPTILFSVFQVDHENVALHMISKQTLTSAGNDFEFPMVSKSNKTCQGP